MINDYLPYEEHKALEAILRHHGVDNAELTKDLAALSNWIRLGEQAKFDRSKAPPLLIALLSTRGIYGRSVLDPLRGVSG